MLPFDAVRHPGDVGLRRGIMRCDGDVSVGCDIDDVAILIPDRIDVLGGSDRRFDRFAYGSVYVPPIHIEGHVAVDPLQLDPDDGAVDGYREMLRPLSLQYGIAGDRITEEIPVTGFGEGFPSEEYVAVALGVRRPDDVSARHHALGREVPLPLVGAERHRVLGRLGVGIHGNGVLIPYRIERRVPFDLIAVDESGGAGLRLGPCDERVSFADYGESRRKLDVHPGFYLLRIYAIDHLSAVGVVGDCVKARSVLDEIRLHVHRTVGFDGQSRGVCDAGVVPRTPSQERVPLLGHS